MTATDAALTAPRTATTDLPVLRSRLLADLPGIVHGITRRVPDLGLADGNLGYGSPRDREDAWAMRCRWSAAIGVDPERLVAAGQVHGADVLRVGAAQAGQGARPGSGRVGIGDALMTDEPGVALLSLHADCLPLLLVDPTRPAVAVVHAGWRGTVAGIAGAAVRAMAAAYGSRRDDLLAFLGPAIGPCCYEVGPEVAAAARASYGASVLRPGERADHPYFDLWAAARQALLRAGLPPERIELAQVCTRCHVHHYFSHRAEGPSRGLFGAIVAFE